MESRPDFNPDMKCPQCGGPTSFHFGLAGGGYGPYTYCDACDAVTSKSDEDDLISGRVTLARNESK